MEILFMKELLDYVSTVTDFRQGKKVLHKMMDIIMLVFFATLANADDWVEIEVFGREHEVFFVQISGTFEWNSIP